MPPLQNDKTAETARQLQGLQLDLLKRLDELINLQRFMNLGQDSSFTFVHGDVEIHMSVPYGDRDFVQRRILQTGSFYELRQLELLRTMGLLERGSIVYDVGANIGNHTTYFCKFLAPSLVVSVEPQKIAFRTLAKNKELNQLDQCRLVNGIIGSHTGSASMVRFANRNLGGTAFEERDGGEFSMLTIDDLVMKESSGKVDFVKIDVEGMHMEVLGGAEKTLRDSRPRVWVEMVDDGSDLSKKAVQEGHNLFERFGYKLHTKLSKNDYLFIPAD